MSAPQALHDAFRPWLVARAVRTVLVMRQYFRVPLLGTWLEFFNSTPSIAKQSLGPKQWYAKVLAHGQTLAFHTCNKPLTERRARGVAQPSHNICERAVPSVVRFREARAARVRCRRAGRVRGREPVVQLKPYTTWWDT